MSLKYFKSKFVCILLGFVFLLQSLVIYKKTLVSIAEATATNHKVLINELPRGRAHEVSIGRK